MICRAKVRDMKALAEYQETLVKRPRLKYIFFELTNKCNLWCLHCGSNCDPAETRILKWEAIQRTLQSIASKYSPNDVMVCLTGGEPLLHPDLDRIIFLAHSMGFPVGITTNGTLIDDHRAERLVQSGLDTVAISIDGTKETHDQFRCSPGSFDRAISGVRALKKQGIEPQAMTVANKSNLDNLTELRDFLLSEGFYSWRITNMDPIGRARENAHLLLSKDELILLLDFIREIRYDPSIEMDITYGCSHFLTLDYEREVRDFYFQCGAGVLIGSVMADGSIGACLDIERRPDLIQGNIEKDDFMSVWETGFKRFRTNRANQSMTCRQCGHRDICRGDSAHTWDYDQNEPKYCIRDGVIRAC